MSFRVPVLLAVASLFLKAGPISTDLATAARVAARPNPVAGEGASADMATAFGNIDQLVGAALRDGKLPGCVVVIGRHDGVRFQRAYGMRELMPERVSMTEDTLFDLASLTKPIATATAVMVLVDQGRLALDDRIDRYVPACSALGKDGVTLRQLLTHTSGLPAETPLSDYEHGRAEAIRRICAAARKALPGQSFVYSDIGFFLLEEAVRNAAHDDFASFVRDSIFAPLDMRETGYNPAPELRRRAAPTELRNGEWIVGDVHDPRAWRLGGVAGNAGLFSTAQDLARYARALLNRGTLDGQRILSEQSVRAMAALHDVPGGIRALGWDVRSRYSANRGDSFSRRAFGHGGFTGTAMWIDPAEDAFVIFLSNRVHPDGKGAVNALAGEIGTIAGRMFAPQPNGVAAASASDDGGPAGGGHVVVGVDVLRRTGFAALRGARLGLVTNASGRAADGARTIDVLKNAPGVTLVALFAPEHGLASKREGVIADEFDAATGLPIYGLYGDRFEPTSDMLQGIDTLIFDIQDAGARFYTYASTLHRLMRTAARRALRVVVLDRPNPLGGVEVSGPVSVPDAASFVNHHPLPVRHGMTLGELAGMIDADEHLGLDLDVIAMSGWRRSSYFDETGLGWVPPSPNLRSIASAVLYPGVALIEGTNMSVGRGTDTPFELVGAPFVDGRDLARALGEFLLSGVRFSPASFVPQANPYAGQKCGGVRLDVVDRKSFEPVRTGIALALALRRLYPAEWQADKIGDIIGNPEVKRAILAGRPLEEIEAGYQQDLAAFRQKRDKYLLYPDDTREAAGR